MFLQLKMIRSSLINDGKFVKYILYALGELVLVVTGILIALQVNNYNVERQFEEIENQYYHSMKLQLIEDKKLLEIEVSGIKERVEDYLTAIQLIKDNSHTDAQLLATKVFRLLEYGDFRRKSSVYQTLTYSGEINNIKNLSIVDNLQEIERSYEITERLEITQARFVMTHAAPAVIQVLDFESVKLISSKLVYTPAFKNIFLVEIRLANEKKREFENVLSVIDSTLKAIDVELYEHVD